MHFHFIAHKFIEFFTDLYYRSVNKMDTQLSAMDEANSQVLNCVDSVHGQEMDIDLENIKAEIVRNFVRNSIVSMTCLCSTWKF